MKRVQLTRGKYTLVDDDDFDYLSQWKWTYGKRYAVRSSKKDDNFAKRKHIRMHRVINKTPDGLQTDHINGDRLDNRKSNLRSATHSINQRNKVKKPFWVKTRNRWRVSLRYNVAGIRKRYSKSFISYSEALDNMRKMTPILQGVELR